MGEMLIGIGAVLLGMLLGQRGTGTMPEKPWTEEATLSMARALLSSDSTEEQAVVMAAMFRRIARDSRVETLKEVLAAYVTRGLGHSTWADHTDRWCEEIEEAKGE